MKDKTTAGHLAALVTILVWGTTFISTKLLLVDLQPVEILFLRFVIGFLALLLAAPRRLKGVGWRQEATFAAAGLCGVCLYYLLENIALTCTMASNVSVILSVAPFFTALLAHVFLRQEERLRPAFFVGFLIAMAGIALISFNGAQLTLHVTGDILAIGAAFVWACYSLLTRRIGGFGYPVLLTTRRTFFWGLLFMLPTLFFFDFHPDVSRLANGLSLFNLLYLGLGASAVCFVTWNCAVKILGVVKTSVYIYITPVVTVIFSVLILKEPVSWASAFGTLLTIAGLFVSQYTGKPKEVSAAHN